MMLLKVYLIRFFPKSLEVICKRKLGNTTIMKYDRVRKEYWKERKGRINVGVGYILANSAKGKS